MSNAESTPLRKLANAEDEGTGDAYEVFEFPKVRGRRGEIRIPRAEARNPQKLQQLLLTKNWDDAALEGSVEDATPKLIAPEPAKYFTYASHVGWRRNLRQFVLHDGVITENGKASSLKPPLWLSNAQHVYLESCGTLADWIDSVARPARYSTRFMLLISAAFAAPLVRVVSLQPFGLNLFGPAKRGKTTALLAAASVAGIGEESKLHNWNRTSAAAQEVARVFNNQLVTVNETGLVEGKKKDVYPRIRDFICQFAEGRDRARHSGSAFATPKGQATWSGLFASTSEWSFSHYAELSGQTRDDGEFARCLDVPAVANGASTIFDCPPKEEKENKSWARRVLAEMRLACAANHGVVFEPYVRYLITHREGLADAVNKDMDAFLAEMQVPETNGALQHAAHNMALVYAGGCAAIDAELLPWERPKLLRAVRSCFRDALADIRTRQRSEADAMEIFLDKLRTARIAHRKKSSDFGPKQHDGYFRRLNGVKEFTLKVAAVTDWLSDRQQEAVLQELAERGLLKDAKGRPVGTDKGAVQRRWPNNANPRCYVFDEPSERAEAKAE